MAIKPEADACLKIDKARESSKMTYMLLAPSGVAKSLYMLSTSSNFLSSRSWNKIKTQIF